MNSLIETNSAIERVKFWADQLQWADLQADLKIVIELAERQLAKARVRTYLAGGIAYPADCGQDFNSDVRTLLDL